MAISRAASQTRGPRKTGLRWLEVRRSRVILSGEPVTRLTYAFQVDAFRKPNLMDAAVTWEFSRSLRVTGGQFKIPFSAENLMADNLNYPVARARAVTALAPGRDIGVQGRDFGVQVAGSLHRRNGPWVEYAAGVFRGQTLVGAPADRFPAVAGRILLHPLPELTVGGDWYGSFSASSGMPKRRAEVEAGYERGPLQLRVEQIWARDGILERRGGYVLAAWRLTRHWEPVTRADWLTTDIRKRDSTSIAYMGGLNFYWGRHVKAGLNAGTQYDQGPRGYSRILLAQTMLMF
jgi:Phosphate-selective porin O and P